VKKELIEAAKVKRQYSKIKARHLQSLKGAPSISAPASLAGEENPPVATSVAADNAALHHDSATESEWNGIADDDMGNAHEAHGKQSPSTAPFMNPDRQVIMEQNQGSDHSNNNGRRRQGLPQRLGVAQQADSDNGSGDGLRAGDDDEDGTRLNEINYSLAAKEGDKDSRRQSKSSRPSRGDQYFSKELAAASKRKAEAEARAQARQAREEERQRRVEERERYRKAMQKARAPGFRDGKRKLGRESTLLLHQVRKSIR